MESGTLELLRCLQSGPFDESNWKHIRATLRGQRRYLRAQNDLATLTDLVQLLESWAQACDNPRLGAEALREAADIAERELAQVERANDLRKRALTHSHSGSERTRVGIGFNGAPLRRADAGLDEAIENYERQLNADADMDVVYQLAELYAQRGAPGDAEQAADLFCTLGDVLGNPGGIPMLQRALEQVPDHAEARALFTQYGGTTPLAPPAPAGARAAAPPTAHRITSHRTAAGLGAPAPVVPSPAAVATAPRLSSSGAGRPPLKAATPIGGRGRVQRTARGQGLVAPEPRGGLASDVAADLDTAQSQPTTEEHARVRDVEPAPNPRANNDNAFDVEPGESDEVDVAAALGHMPAKGPPPLKSAKQRARELQPMPQTAPVITIKQSQATGTSAAPTASVSSLSPVVVEQERSLERSRERLRSQRIRRRKIAAAVLGAAAIAAVAVAMFAPGTLQDARHYAQNLAGGETETGSSVTSTSSATQPPATPEPTAVTPEPTSPSAAPTPAPESPAVPNTAAQQAPAAEQPAEPKTAEPAEPGRTVQLHLDQANLRGGKLTEAQLTSAFERAAPKLDKCYADALEKRPRLKGKLIVSWTVRPNGKVVGAKKQGGTLKDAELIRCTLDAISSTKFPKPRRQAAQIRLPIEYRRS